MDKDDKIYKSHMAVAKQISECGARIKSLEGIVQTSITAGQREHADFRGAIDLMKQEISNMDEKTAKAIAAVDARTKVLENINARITWAILLAVLYAVLNLVITSPIHF